MDAMTDTQTLTQLEFEEADFEKAEKIAAALGYTQTAYTSTSALWGLFCLPDNSEHKSGCIIKTNELGMLFVQDGEDLHLGYDFEDVAPKLPRYTLEEIEAMPTLHAGQYDNLKYEDGERKVWLSRLTVEDGQPYDNQVTVEFLHDGAWVAIDEYEAR